MKINPKATHKYCGLAMIPSAAAPDDDVSNIVHNE